jgi:hypothetical protein
MILMTTQENQAPNMSSADYISFLTTSLDGEVPA